MLIPRAEFSFSAHDISVDTFLIVTAQWTWKWLPLMLMNYQCHSPHKFALRNHSSGGYCDLILSQKLTYTNVMKYLKVIYPWSMWFLQWDHSNISQKQVFQNSVVTLLWHFMSSVWMIHFKSIWIVNSSRTVLESSRRCQVCWLSEVSICMELLCCLACWLPQRPLESALAQQVLDLLYGVPVYGNFKTLAVLQNR